MYNPKNALLASLRRMTVPIAVVLLLPRWARAETVLHMNLQEICEHADRIFRGTVVSATPGILRVAGLDLPTTTYRLQVVEAFKGEFPGATGERYAEVRMLGALEPERKGAGPIVTVVSGMPRLEVGGSYLLLTTRPSRIGMSTTVGLGQGLFRITGSGSDTEAVNEHENRMLFRGMDAQGHPGRGPIAYRKLAQRVRALVGRRAR